MSEPFDIASRLTFHNVDEDALSILKDAQSFLIKEMDAILDQVYQHLGRVAGAPSFFRDRDQVAQAKTLLAKHWSHIASGQFDDRYEMSVIKLANAHSQFGLDVGSFIAGYNVLISAMTARIQESYSGSAQRKAKLQAAFVKVTLFDLESVIGHDLKDGEAEKTKVLNNLAAEFEQHFGGVVDILKDVAKTLGATAFTLTKAVEATLSRTNFVANSAEQASLSVQSVATAAEQLSHSVQEIGSQVAKSSTVSKQALSNADASTAKVRELSEAAQKIGDVVNFIGSIAKQTNLLALNATIEAARAGEAGRGFAVVAQEVKALAEQTTRATADIGSQIKAVQDSTVETVITINTISEIIRSLDSIATSVASAVDQQGSATLEIARNVSRAASGTKEVSSSIMDVSNATGDAGAASKKILEASESLSAQADQLRGQVENFLTIIRQASNAGARGDRTNQRHVA